jgi:hypothetical protein
MLTLCVAFRIICCKLLLFVIDLGLLKTVDKAWVLFPGGHLKAGYPEQAL